MVANSKYYFILLLLFVWVSVAFNAPSRELKIELKLATTSEPMPFVAIWIVDTDLGGVADSLGTFRISLDDLDQDTLCLMFRYWTANDTTVCLPLPMQDTTILIQYPDKSGRKNGSGWR